mgnify:FL=1
MAKKRKMTRKPVSSRCPTNIKADEKKTGMCFRTERVQRDGHKGYITSYFSRSSGRAAGFATTPGACKRTMDPFQASIRTKTKAEEIGRHCAVQSTKKK